MRIFALPLLSLLVFVAACPPAPAPGSDSKKERSGPKDDEPTPKREKIVDDEESDDGSAASRADPSEGYVPMPRKPALALDDAQLATLLAAARAGCDGKAAPSTSVAGEAPVIAVVYSADGTRKNSARDQGPLVTTAHNAGKRACAGKGGEAFLHLLVVTQQAHFLNFGIKGLFDNKVFEPQVTGIVYKLNGRSFELDPLEQLERNMGPSDVRTAMAKGIGISAGEMPNRIDLTFEMYRTAHVGERYPDKKTQRFFRGHEVLTPENVTHALMAERLKLIGDWYRNNVIDGEVTYAYMPSRKAFQNDERTMIRSTMSAWVMNRLAEHLDDKELKDKGKQVIEYYFERYFNMKESMQKGAIQPSKKPLVNGNLVENRWTVASFIAAACRERDDKANYAEEIELLMTWAASHQRSDGVIWTPSGGEQYFMPGQFLLPVTYFYRDTKDPRYKEIFDKAFAVYEPQLYQMMDFGPGWYTPYAPAWFTQPLTQMYLETKDDRYRDLVFAINDRVIHAYETNARHQVYPDYDGMLAPKAGSFGNNSVTAASLESLTDATIVAKTAGDMERFRRYRKVVQHTVAYLLRLQFTPANSYYVRERQRVVGAFKNDLVNSKVWMDSVWHLTSAFMKIQEHKLLEE
jgi:hypothetical protein